MVGGNKIFSKLSHKFFAATTAIKCEKPARKAWRHTMNINTCQWIMNKLNFKWHFIVTSFHLALLLKSLSRKLFSECFPIIFFLSPIYRTIQPHTRLQLCQVKKALNHKWHATSRQQTKTDFNSVIFFCLICHLNKFTIYVKMAKLLWWGYL